MHFTHLLDDTFRQDLEAMAQDSTLSDSALHNDAERHLKVLALSSFTDINQPPWVRRIQPFWGFPITYTSSKLFDALYQTADELGFICGRRYVSAAVCLCAYRTEIEVGTAPLEDAPKRKAEALSQLASEWIAFMLWSSFVNGAKAGAGDELLEEELGSLPESPEEMPLQSYNGRPLVDGEHLLKRCGYTCFMSGYVHNCAPPELLYGPVRVTVTDLHVAHIFRPSSAARDCSMTVEDEAVTSVILKHYCYPVCVDGVEVIEVVAEARNSLLMWADTCSAFNSFRWRLRPTPVPDQYHIDVYERNRAGTQYVVNPIAFKDHTHEYPSSSRSESPQTSAAPPSSSTRRRGNSTGPPRAHDVDLPSADLLRVHAALAGVLQLSGAITAFDAIFSSLALFAKPCIPGASGSAFLRSVVAYEGRGVCADVEMQPVQGSKGMSAKDSN
ncbi:hypothetical protein V8D89_004016 [Ganoderma adspersum]